jgi:hypothetical protein
MTKLTASMKLVSDIVLRFLFARAIALHPSIVKQRSRVRLAGLLRSTWPMNPIYAADLSDNRR